MTTAGSIPQTWITEARTITVTGRLIGVLGIGNRIHLTLELPATATVERVKDTP